MTLVIPRGLQSSFLCDICGTAHSTQEEAFKHRIVCEASGLTCDVCFRTGSPLAKCTRCMVSVHPTCIGLRHLPKPWECRSCRLGIPLDKRECVLCPNKGGLLARTSGGEMVHLSCCLWGGGSRVVRNAKREVEADISSAIVYDDPCLHCKTPNTPSAQVSCLICGKHCHVRCAGEAGFELSLVALQEYSSWDCDRLCRALAKAKVGGTSSMHRIIDEFRRRSIDGLALGELSQSDMHKILSLSESEINNLVHFVRSKQQLKIGLKEREFQTLRGVWVLCSNHRSVPKCTDLFLKLWRECYDEKDEQMAVSVSSDSEMRNLIKNNKKKKQEHHNKQKQKLKQKHRGSNRPKKSTSPLSKRKNRSKSGRHRSKLAMRQKQLVNAEVYKTSEIPCLGCEGLSDEANFLLCENEHCQNGAHVYCLDPPLSRVPDENWFCPDCDPEPARETCILTRCVYCRSCLYHSELQKIECQSDHCHHTCHLECLFLAEHRDFPGPDDQMDLDSIYWDCPECLNGSNEDVNLQYTSILPTAKQLFEQGKKGPTYCMRHMRMKIDELEDSGHHTIETVPVTDHEKEEDQNDEDVPMNDDDDPTASSAISNRSMKVESAISANSIAPSTDDVTMRDDRSLSMKDGTDADSLFADTPVVIKVEEQDDQSVDHGLDHNEELKMTEKSEEINNEPETPEEPLVFNIEDVQKIVDEKYSTLPRMGVVCLTNLIGSVINGKGVANHLKQWVLKRSASLKNDLIRILFSEFQFERFFIEQFNLAFSKLSEMDVVNNNDDTTNVTADATTSAAAAAATDGDSSVSLPKNHDIKSISDLMDNIVSVLHDFCVCGNTPSLDDTLKSTDDSSDSNKNNSTVIGEGINEKSVLPFRVWTERLLGCVKRIWEDESVSNHLNSNIIDNAKQTEHLLRLHNAAVIRERMLKAESFIVLLSNDNINYETLFFGDKSEGYPKKQELQSKLGVLLSIEQRTAKKENSKPLLCLRIRGADQNAVAEANLELSSVMNEANMAAKMSQVSAAMSAAAVASGAGRLASMVTSGAGAGTMTPRIPGHLSTSMHQAIPQPLSGIPPSHNANAMYSAGQPTNSMFPAPVRPSPASSAAGPTNGYHYGVPHPTPPYRGGQSAMSGTNSGPPSGSTVPNPGAGGPPPPFHSGRQYSPPSRYGGPPSARETRMEHNPPPWKQRPPPMSGQPGTMVGPPDPANGLPKSDQPDRNGNSIGNGAASASGVGGPPGVPVSGPGATNGSGVPDTSAAGKRALVVFKGELSQRVTPWLKVTHKLDDGTVGDKPYYWNRDTNETRWDEPPEGFAAQISSDDCFPVRTDTSTAENEVSDVGNPDFIRLRRRFGNIPSSGSSTTSGGMSSSTAGESTEDTSSGMMLPEGGKTVLDDNTDAVLQRVNEERQLELERNPPKKSSSARSSSSSSSHSPSQSSSAMMNPSNNTNSTTTRMNSTSMISDLPCSHRVAESSASPKSPSSPGMNNDVITQQRSHDDVSGLPSKKSSSNTGRHLGRSGSHSNGSGLETGEILTTSSVNTAKHSGSESTHSFSQSRFGPAPMDDRDKRGSRSLSRTTTTDRGSRGVSGNPSIIGANGRSKNQHTHAVHPERRRGRSFSRSRSRERRTTSEYTPFAD